MIKITTNQKPLAQVDKKYVRLVVTAEKPDWHRLVETKEAQLEFRLGIGKASQLTPRQYITLVRSIVQAAKHHQIEYLALELTPTAFAKLKQYNEAWFYSTLAENLLLAAYEFRTYKSTDKKRKALKEILICGPLSAAAKAGLERGQIVGREVNYARDLANTSGADLTPAALAAAAKAAAKNTGIKVRVLDTKELKQLKMGLLLAVGQGSHHEAKLIVMEYSGAKKTERPVVLIGKGITYDTGGLYLKPQGSMNDMHMDMSGGGAVIAAITAAAKLKLKQNIVALIPTAENTVSDKSMRNGDIITSMSGKTVEVVHTDAEGRLILADALTYSERYQPRVILDVATLTGAAMVALGQQASAIMTTDDKLAERLRALGEESGDYLWPLPLWDEYRQYIKSNRADIANIAPNFSKWGGAIEGGTFLSQFAPKGVPWAHIDMAPRMEAIPADKLAKGSTGEPVRLLIKFLETH